MDSSQAAEAGSSFVPLLVYNGTTATGGNSLTEDLNLFYQVSIPSRLKAQPLTLFSPVI